MLKRENDIQLHATKEYSIFYGQFTSVGKCNSKRKHIDYLKSNNVQKTHAACIECTK